MYVVINSKDIPMLHENKTTESKNDSSYAFHVGFFKPNGHFHTLKTFKNESLACNFIHFLNGGSAFPK